MMSHGGVIDNFRIGKNFAEKTNHVIRGLGLKAN
jgi:hypothetical protein